MQNPLEKFRPQDLDRFHAKYSKGPYCWEWTSVLKARGLGKQKYAFFFIKLPRDRKKFISASRAAYAIAYGPFDYTLHVLHKCDNPRCVNPEHLFLGTNSDNIADKVAKNRARGSKPLPPNMLR